MTTVKLQPNHKKIYSYPYHLSVLSSKLEALRTVPPFVTVHTFCASPDIQVSYILVPRAYDLFGQRWDRRALVSAIIAITRSPTQSPLAFWSAGGFGQRHGSRALAGSENRKSANHGIPAFCAASEI